MANGGYVRAIEFGTVGGNGPTTPAGGIFLVFDSYYKRYIDSTQPEKKGAREGEGGYILPGGKIRTGVLILPWLSIREPWPAIRRTLAMGHRPMCLDV